MENEQNMDTKSDDSQVQQERMQSRCKSVSESTQRAGISPMAVSRTSVNLTEREFLIYQAGQSFGAAQAFRQAAEAVNSLAQRLNAQAAKHQEAGNSLLDQALGKVPNPSKTPVYKRVANALSVLSGASD